MKKTYTKPKLVIECFPGMDVIVCSSGENPGDDEGGFTWNSAGTSDD